MARIPRSFPPDTDPYRRAAAGSSGSGVDGGGAGGGSGGALDACALAGVADSLRLAEPVRSFARDFPFELKAVECEIERAVNADPQAIAQLLRRQQTKKKKKQDVVEIWRDLLLTRLRNQLDRYRKVNEMTQPFRQFLGPVWGLDPGSLRPTVLDIWNHYEALQQNRKKIKEIARRLGRLQDAMKKHLQRVLRETPMPRTWPLERAGKSTLVGVRESDDLSSLLSVEGGLLASRLTEPLFFLKYAEKKLLTYDYRIEDPEPSRQRSPRRRRRRQVLGPMILILDTSGSMEGSKESAAKALALVLIRIALGQRRDVRIINFSTRTAAFNLFPPKISQRQLLEFLSFSFHGGTDAGPALDSAFAMLAKQRFSRADILFLTDGEMLPLDARREARMEKARQDGHSFYGVVIGKSGREAWLAQMDKLWRYDEPDLTELIINLDSYSSETAGQLVRPR